MGAHLIVEYGLSFEDYLDARNEKGTLPENSKNSFTPAWRFILLLGGFALITWNPISATILLSGTLIILAAIVASHFLKQRAIERRNNELRSDFQRFSSGKYTFEADVNGWRLYSEHGEQVHRWEDLFIIKESPRILFLVTYSGACTLPKAAFTAEELAQLKAWLKAWFE
jgi:YcxB-like protein